MSNCFLKEIVDSGDLAALDIYFTYRYDQTFEGCKKYHGKEHKQNLGLYFKSNLIIKHSLNKPEIEKKIKSTLPKFIYLTASNDLPTAVIRQITEEILQSDIKKRIEDLDNLEKEVLSFVLSYISLKTQERSLALDLKDKDYYLIIRASASSEDKKDILYYKLSSSTGDFEKWTRIFNQLFDRNVKFSQKSSISDFGDILVKSGLGYWEPWFTNRLNVHEELVILKFLYDIATKYKALLPEIQNFETRVKEIEKKLPDEIAIEDYLP